MLRQAQHEVPDLNSSKGLRVRCATFATSSLAFFRVARRFAMGCKICLFYLCSLSDSRAGP